MHTIAPSSTHGLEPTADGSAPAPASTGEASLDPVEWTELAALGHRMVDEMLEWLRSVRSRPTWRPTTPELRARIAAEELPSEPRGAERAYEDFRRDVLPFALGNVHPRFWGWVCGTGSPSAMLYEMLAAGMNSSSGGFDQAAILVEQQVLDWLKQVMRFPREASGLLVSGGSAANLVALAVARQQQCGADVRVHGVAGLGHRWTVYASSETHSSIQRALELLGLGSESLRKLPVRPDYSADVPALERAIRADRRAGLEPIALVGNAGTVNTGAIDALDALADLAQRESLWFHVDGAIGAPAMLSGELAPRLAGLERADSVAFDLHKWMHVPYEAGCVLVRDARAHRETFSLTPPYLASHERGVLANAPFMADYGPQLSRGFRALKVWMLLKEHGTERYARLIERNVAQAQRLAALVEADPRLELLAPVGLNIVCLRYRGERALKLDELNHELLYRLQESGACVPSSTLLGGRFALRVSLTNHRTRDEDLELFVTECVRHGDQLAEEGRFDVA